MLAMPLAFWIGPSAGAAKTEGPGIAGVMQRVQHNGMGQLGPCGLARARLTSPWKLDAFTPEGLHRAPSRAGAHKRGKEMAQALLRLFVRIQDHPLVFIVNQSDGQRHLQLAALGLAENAAQQARSEHMQFGFTHRAFESEQEPVVKLARIVESVFIKDERVSQSANLQKAMPIGAVASQAGHLQPHHDARFAQAHLGNQTLKALAINGRSARLALVMINDDNPFLRPTQGQSALAQPILPLRALRVFEHLAQRGLADVEIGRTFEMLGGDF